MARRFLFPLLLGCVLAIAGPVSSAAAEGEAATPSLPLPVAPDVGATVGEAVGTVTGSAQQTVESVTKPPPAPSAPAPAPPSAPPSGAAGDRPSRGGGPVEQVTHAAAETVPGVTRAVTKTAAAATGRTPGAAESPVPAAASPAPAEPVADASASADPPVAPGDRRGNRAARGHRRASEPAAPAEPPGRPGIERLARAVGALVEERASGLGSGLDLSGSTTAVASGLGTTLADLARPFAGDTAATTVDSRGAAAVSDSRPASSPAALPALLDPSRPASILLFFLVLGGGAALLVYAFRRELVGGPGRRRRHRA